MTVQHGFAFVPVNLTRVDSMRGGTSFIRRRHRGHRKGASVKDSWDSIPQPTRDRITNAGLRLAKQGAKDLGKVALMTGVPVAAYHAIRKRHK